MMQPNKATNRPLGMLLIAAFYAFGAIMLLIGMVLNPVEVSRVIAERHGLPPSIGVIIVPVVAALALAIAYGLAIRAVWGFWLTIVYLIYFGSVSFILAGPASTQPYLGNLMWSVVVVIYLLIARKHFFGPKDAAAQATNRPRA